MIIVNKCSLLALAYAALALIYCRTCSCTCRHRKAEDVRLQQSFMSRAASTAHSTAKAAFEGVLPVLLLCALWLIIECIPGSKFPSLLALLGLIGAVKLDHKYNHSRYFWSCLFALSEVVLRLQLAAVGASPYFSIMMDSSTDINSEDHVLIYVQYVDRDTFTTHVQYLCAVKVTAKTAEVVYNALVMVLQALGIDIKRMAGFCSDGGSEYAGKHSGVAVTLKNNHVPYLITNHCAAHRAALVMSDTAKRFKGGSDVMSLDELDHILRDVHGLFAHSSKRCGQWKRFASKYGVTAFKFPMFNATRWFSRFECVRVLTDNLPALLLFLEIYSSGWSSAEKLLETLKHPTKVGQLMALCDVMWVMQKFSTELQSDSVMPHHVHQLVADAVVGLKACTVDDNDGMQQVNKEVLKKYNAFVSKFDSESGRWQFKTGKRVKLSGSDVFSSSTCLDFAQDLAQDLVQSTEARFPHMHVLRAFRVLDPATYKGFTAAEARVHSEFRAECALLNGHFSNSKLSQRLYEVDKSRIKEVQEEFSNLRAFLAGLVAKSPGISMRAAWAIIAADHRAVFPHALQLAYVALCVPVQTATVERGFSMHRVIKHKLTNSLRLVTIDSLMRLKLLGPADAQAMAGFKSQIDFAVDVVNESGGFGGDKKPLYIGKLFKAACNIDVPVSLDQGVDLPDDEIDLDAFTDDSDDDSADFSGSEADSAADESDDAPMHTIDGNEVVQVEEVDQDMVDAFGFD